MPRAGAQGDECNFSHEAAGAARRPSLRPEPCKFYLSGSCFRGSRCVFMHAETPCLYFHAGNCSAGERCRFSHEPLTDETEHCLRICRSIRPLADPSAVRPIAPSLSSPHLHMHMHTYTYVRIV